MMLKYFLSFSTVNLTYPTSILFIGQGINCDLNDLIGKFWISCHYMVRSSLTYSVYYIQGRNQKLLTKLGDFSVSNVENQNNGLGHDMSRKTSNIMDECTCMSAHKFFLQHPFPLSISGSFSYFSYNTH